MYICVCASHNTSNKGIFALYRHGMSREHITLQSSCVLPSFHLALERCHQGSHDPPSNPHTLAHHLLNSHSFLTNFPFFFWNNPWNCKKKKLWVFFFKVLYLKPIHYCYIVTQYNHCFFRQRHSVEIWKEGVAARCLQFRVFCIGFSRFYFLFTSDQTLTTFGTLSIFFCYYLLLVHISLF